jgi:spore maturation protein CgeB
MKMFSEDIVRKILLSEVCDVDNGVTHLIVVDGMYIPKNIIATARKMGVTTVLITTEDPHCADATQRLHSLYDYVFSNDRNAAEMFGVHYLPTAASSKCFSSEIKDIDVLFVGAIYPNRCPFLNNVASMCVKNGMSMKVVGPLYKCVPDEPLASIVEDKMISPEECIALQARSKVCLNVFRDASRTDTGSNMVFSIPSYSLNPRCYDVPMCGSILLTDHRPEVVRLFGDDCIFNDDNSCEKILDHVKNYDSKKDIRDKQKKSVEEGHLYLHRAICLLSAIGQGFCNK